MTRLFMLQKRCSAVLSSQSPITTRVIRVASTILASFAAIASLGSDGERSQAGITVRAIGQSQLPERIKSALQKQVEENLKGTQRGAGYSWICEVDGAVGVAVAIKNTSRTKLAAASASQSSCFSELILWGIRKSRFEAFGFNDNELLREALLSEDGMLWYRGIAKSVLFESYEIDSWSVTVAYCPLDGIAGELLAPDEIKTLSENYANAGHHRICRALKSQEWSGVEKAWIELEKKHLLSPELVIDYGKCLVQQGKISQSVDHFAHYLYGYRDLQDGAFFLKVAGVLEPLVEQNKAAEHVAFKAIDEAEKRMLGTQNKIDLPSSPIP